MKTKHCNCIWLLVVFLALSDSESRGCSSPPPPFFNFPSYIDSDYKTPPYSEIKYGRRRMFGMLLNQFAKFEPATDSAADARAREESKEQEKERYEEYSRGSELFQSGSIADAYTRFVELKGRADAQRSWLSKLFGWGMGSWAREASTYMMARCKLVLSQNLWSGYGDPVSAVDQSVLEEADSLYSRYLQEYPSGLYVSSARNIRRRIYYLSGKRSLLNNELRDLMLAQFPSHTGVSGGKGISTQIVEEFQNFCTDEFDFGHDSPILTAHAWLGDKAPNPEDLKRLELRERDFAGYPGLFRYVRALGLYKLERYQELLDKTTEEPPVKTVLWLSTQLLRARALATLGNTEAARSALKTMHDVSPEDAVDVETAILMLNRGDGLWLFTDKSFVTNERNLRSFALFGLTDHELELGVKMPEIAETNRQIIGNELARRYMLSGRFKELAGLLDHLANSPFLPLKETADTLTRDYWNANALVELGEFLFKNGINPNSNAGSPNGTYWFGDPGEEYSNRCKPCELYRERIASYTSPMKLFLSAAESARNSGRRSESEAKALHYIVIGGHPRHQLQCSWTYAYDDSARARGKEAYFRLHKLYPNSEWAKETPYYY